VYLYVGPEKSQAKNIIWKDPQGLFKFLPNELIKKKNEVELTVYFKQTVPKTPGSVFYIEGADNIDRMRGLKPKGIILDEYAQIKPELWTEVLFPAINQSGGWVIFIGTFKGKNHFYDLFSKFWDWEKLEQIAHQDYAAFYLPYWKNEFFTEDQIRAAKETMPPLQFDQEYGCLPMSGSSNVFPSLRELMTGSLQTPHPAHLYSMGVDLAKYQDFTAVSIIDRNTHELIFQERWQADWSQTLEKIILIRNRYNKAHITIDSTGVGDPIAELLSKRGVKCDDFKFSQTSKDQLVKKMGVFFSEKKLKLPPVDQIPNLINELEQFTYEILPSGKIRYSAPGGMHDDEVMSLGLAIWFLKDQPTQDTYSTFVPRQTIPNLDPFDLQPNNALQPNGLA
jgi:Terminase large subunit, T4likevirus-type, N-terminal/Terminase RNaseH-like domain